MTETSKTPLWPPSAVHMNLLSAIFDWLDFDDLLRASWVSVQWRFVARMHATYWLRVELTSGSNGAVQLFLARLDFFDDAMLRVLVGIDGDFQLAPALADAVVDGIARQMGRMDDLVVNLAVLARSSTYITRWNFLLSSSAPRLQTLRLSTLPTVPFTLPFIVFGERCPLKMLQLNNVLFPQPAQWVFTGVRYLELRSTGPLADAGKILSGFAMLETLIIQAPSLCGDMTLEPEALPLCTAVSLDIIDGPSCAKLLRSKRFRSIPAVQLVWSPSSQPALDLLFAPLFENLHIIAKRGADDNLFNVSISRNRGVIRMLTSVPLDRDTYGVQFPERILPNIEEIYAPLDLLGPVADLVGGALPALKVVHIPLHRPRAKFAWRFVAPRVRTIVLHREKEGLERLSLADAEYLRRKALEGTSRTKMDIASPDGIEIGGDQNFAEVEVELEEAA
ncbi:hypothetical protein EXIGLDRAFT_844760 [Exidia glandulosa HHB12029]|uniref:F-box domain-containing protein n=1 Tax=Exidia glandulosa HHB12029 TaxID=1314781 RepID=A0A165BUH9_EXIGL|nr:hypothetical protein EXIGLDRAFT_844760 [Exidia glandulosa HHB12029]